MYTFMCLYTLSVLTSYANYRTSQLLRTWDVHEFWLLWRGIDNEALKWIKKILSSVMSDSMSGIVCTLKMVIIL